MERTTPGHTTASTVTRESSARWGGPFVLGLIVLLLGIVALSASVITSLVSVIFYGVILFASGISEIIYGFRRRKQEGGGTALFVLAGVLSIVVGFLIFSRPLVGLTALTLLLAGYFLVNGLFRFVTSIADRYPGWGLDCFYGVVAVFLGVIVIAQLPEASLWLLGTLIGIEIIFRGIALISAALTLRKVNRALVA